jgi:hemoglobin-like flavoprotein
MDASLLRASFDLIAPRKEEFAEAFYHRLFEKYPETRQLFAQTDMPKQARTLAATLAMIVAGIEKGENVVPLLQGLGARHTSYHVLPEHYPLVEEVLLETFQSTLGPQWTPAYQDTWTEAYQMIAQTMAG